MTRQQIQQFVNWVMAEGDTIENLVFQHHDHTPIITLKRANGHRETMHWRQWGENEVRWGLVD